MGTPRPTIDVDNLDIETRPWPKCVNQHYHNGERYCFRVGKMEYVRWKWPWPEWIGIPKHENIEVWLDLIGAWKRANLGKYDVDYMDKCIAGMLRYL
jgi:hypothetical protein